MLECGSLFSYIVILRPDEQSSSEPLIADLFFILMFLNYREVGVLTA